MLGARGLAFLSCWAVFNINNLACLTGAKPGQPRWRGKGCTNMNWHRSRCCMACHSYASHNSCFTSSRVWQGQYAGQAAALGKRHAHGSACDPCRPAGLPACMRRHEADIVGAPSLCAQLHAGAFIVTSRTSGTEEVGAALAQGLPLPAPRPLCSPSQTAQVGRLSVEAAAVAPAGRHFQGHQLPSPLLATLSAVLLAVALEQSFSPHPSSGAGTKREDTHS